MSLDFSGKHVVVTGGTGALGTAVVGGLLAAGATCTVPYVHEAEAQRFPHRGDAKVKLIAVERIEVVLEGLNIVGVPEEAFLDQPRANAPHDRRDLA